MTRQQRTIGAIVKIVLKNDTYAYAQILDKASYAFFDYFSKSELENLDELKDKSVLYILSAYDDIITKGKWLKIGEIPIKDELLKLPMQFIQDAINPKKFEIYNPNTGEMKTAKKEDCKGLEQAAVWEDWEVEERLLNHFEGHLDKTIEEYNEIFN